MRRLKSPIKCNSFNYIAYNIEYFFLSLRRANANITHALLTRPAATVNAEEQLLRKRLNILKDKRPIVHPGR